MSMFLRKLADFWNDAIKTSELLKFIPINFDSFKKQIG